MGARVGGRQINWPVCAPIWEKAEGYRIKRPPFLAALQRFPPIAARIGGRQLPYLISSKRIQCAGAEARREGSLFSGLSVPPGQWELGILDNDETGATGKFQSQTLHIARYCVRERIILSSDSPAGTRDTLNTPRLEPALFRPLILPG